MNVFILPKQSFRVDILIYYTILISPCPFVCMPLLVPVQPCLDHKFTTKKDWLLILEITKDNCLRWLITTTVYFRFQYRTTYNVDVTYPNGGIDIIFFREFVKRNF